MSSIDHLKLSDTQQTWWQLAAIQLSGFTSLPILASSVLILLTSNLTSAIITLVIGNILLWIIRWGLISMSHENRKSVLDISRDYLGKFGSYFIALLLLAATLAWFVEETTFASHALVQIIPINGGLGVNRFFQMGVLLGMISTLLCINGMILLRWLSMICFPLLFFAFLILVLFSDHHISAVAGPGFSLAGLPLYLATSLGISVDLPTFFRHSRSHRDSVFALSAIQLISFAISLGALFLGSFIIPWLDPSQITAFPSDSLLIKSALVILIFLSVICTNVSNVYSASVGWELIAPLLAGAQEFLIIGLGSTIVFVLAANIFSFALLANLTSSFLVNLGIVFIIAFFNRLFFHRQPNRFEQTTYFSAWLLAAIVNMLQLFNLISWISSTIWAGFVIIFLIIGGSQFLQWLMQKSRTRG